MRRLLLLRHAKTEHDAPSGHDQDRRLDERGRLDAAAIGGWIGRHPPLPDTVLVSTAVRAHQTWDIAREAMRDAARENAPEPQVELLNELYGAELPSCCRSSAWPRPRTPKG
jgi:phosphohistidine phosphatase